jgi:hypothetical protein
MHPTRPAGLGPTAQTHIFQQRFHFQRYQSHIFPGDSRAGIEINAQLVRMIQIVRANRVRVELDAAQVNNPGKTSRVINHDFFGNAS